MSRAPLITVTPTTEPIASCLACGMENYEKVQHYTDRSTTTVYQHRDDVTLYAVSVTANPSRIIHLYCLPCLKILRRAIHEAMPA